MVNVFFPWCFKPVRYCIFVFDLLSSVLDDLHILIWWYQMAGLFGNLVNFTCWSDRYQYILCYLKKISSLLVCTRAPRFLYCNGVAGFHWCTNRYMLLMIALINDKYLSISVDDLVRFTLGLNLIILSPQPSDVIGASLQGGAFNTVIA